MAAKTREEKNQERKAHLAVAPTPETAQVLTGAPAVTLDQRIDDALESGNHTDPDLHIAICGSAMAHLALTHTSDTESATAMQAKDPNVTFLTFIRSPKGLDLADARVRDTFDLEHRLKVAYLAGWGAARA